VAQCTGEVGHGRVYGDHFIGRRDGSCGVQKVLEPASGILDVLQARSFVYCGSEGCCNGLKMGSQPVEFSCNIATHLQADPIGILERQVFGEFHDRRRSSVIVFVLRVAAPDESDTPAAGGAVFNLGELVIRGPGNLQVGSGKLGEIGDAQSRRQAHERQSATSPGGFSGIAQQPFHSGKPFQQRS
jgi:hypothetical protein